MVRIVDVFSETENEWLVELVEFVVREFDIVFDTITVGVRDSSSPCFVSFLCFEEGEVLRALDVVDEEGELAITVGLDLKVLSIVGELGFFERLSLLKQTFQVVIGLGLCQSSRADRRLLNEGLS